jgi:hypothetical protein
MKRHLDREYLQERKKLKRANKLLNQVFNHAHGQNMDGTHRRFPDEDGVGRNYQKLIDAIGNYLTYENQTEEKRETE